MDPGGRVGRGTRLTPRPLDPVLALVPVEESSSAAAVLLLAVIQGLTEFLPVSSSGHLVLARISMDLRSAGLALDVALHLGIGDPFRRNAQSGRLGADCSNKRPAGLGSVALELRGVHRA